MNKYLREHHRTVKVIIAIILVALGFFLKQWWIYIIAAMFLIMAILNFCPAEYFEKRKLAQKN